MPKGFAMIIERGKEFDLIVNGPSKVQRKEGSMFSAFMGLGLKEVEDEQLEEVQKVTYVIGTTNGTVNDEEEWRCDAPGEDKLVGGEEETRISSAVIPMQSSTSKQRDLTLDSQIFNHDLSDSGVRNCNRLFWMNIKHSEAIRIWNIGKEVGFSFTRDDDVVIGCLHAMKIRDKSDVRRASTSRLENSLSDDEAN